MGESWDDIEFVGRFTIDYPMRMMKNYDDDKLL